ncbi:hypothetical protein OFN34_29045, partial [Escherichia coli]|nr:hypothetical protein [Escherichia coli]
LYKIQINLLRQSETQSTKQKVAYMCSDFPLTFELPVLLTLRRSALTTHFLTQARSIPEFRVIILGV